MKSESEHTCTICNSPYNEAEGGVEGELGIIPVQFCPFCLAGLADMFDQFQDEERA